MLLVVGHCLEADLGTTSTEDLEVVADVGGQDARGKLGAKIVCHRESLSID